MTRRVTSQKLILLTVVVVAVMMLFKMQKTGESGAAYALSDKIGNQKVNTDYIVSTVADLPGYLRAIDDRVLFDRLYRVDEKDARLTVPDTFQEKVKDMFKAYPGGSESLHFVEKQTLVTIRNKITYEHSLFNKIRRYRPGYREKLTEAEEDLLKKQIEDTKGAGCDFCNPDRTASDIFGKIYGKHCYVAANVAKYEKWHSLLISKHHSPLEVSQEAIIDYIATARKWFESVRSADGTAVAPHLMWDSTGRASASQIHQHMQMSINTFYYQKAEESRQKAAKYAATYGGNMWSDIAVVHDSLGLVLKKGSTILMVHLTPVKEREIIVFGRSNQESFAVMLHVAIASLLDAGTRAFSASVVFEQLNDAAPHIPAVARIIDRGAPNDVRNDVGAMEFYGSNNVGQDPFELMKKVRSTYERLQNSN